MDSDSTPGSYEIIPRAESSQGSIDETNDSANQNNDESSFKKHSWLNEWFSRDELNIVCNSCKKSFKSRHNSRLISHLNRCPEFDKDKMPVIEEDENTKTTQFFLKFAIENNIPLTSIETNTFKEFISRDLKKWKKPSRYELSSIYAVTKSRMLQQQFMNELNSNKISKLTIEFDHWSELGGRSILGVIASRADGRKYLLDLIDVSLKGHSSLAIVDDLKTVIESIGPNVVNSIMSDSASSCKKAREDLTSVDGFAHIIQHRCLAHLFNLIGSKTLSKTPILDQAVKNVSSITSFLSQSSHWIAHVRSCHLKKPKIACPTRWYSTLNMIENLLSMKTVICEEILPNLTTDKSQAVRRLDWKLIEVIAESIKPLNHCIGILERADVSLGEAFREILLYMKRLFLDLDTNQMTLPLRKRFIHQFVKIDHQELGLYIAAYLLDQRYDFEFISDDGIDIALKSIITVADKSEISMRRLEGTLITDFESYRTQQDEFERIDAKCKPKDWWSKRVATGPLAQVALRFANLRASSANIERVFSVARGIQGLNRSGFLLSTLTDITRIKIDLKDGLRDRYLDGLELDEPDTSLQQTTDDASQRTNSIDSLDEDIPEWTDNDQLKQSKEYRSFFKFFDFSAMHDRNSGSSVPDRATQERVDEMVKRAREIRNRCNRGEIYRFDNLDVENDDCSDVGSYQIS